MKAGVKTNKPKKDEKEPGSRIVAVGMKGYFPKKNMKMLKWNNFCVSYYSISKHLSHLNLFFIQGRDCTYFRECNPSSSNEVFKRPHYCMS